MADGYFPKPPRRCPKCGGNVYVVHSEPRYDGLDRLGIHDKIIRRRLECDNCGERYTSYEITAEALAVLKEARKETDRRARKLKTILGVFETAIKNCKKKIEDVYNDNQS